MPRTELSTLAALIRDGQLPEIRIRLRQVGPILIPLPVVVAWVDSRVLLWQCAPPWLGYRLTPILFLDGEEYEITICDPEEEEQPDNYWD